MEKITGIRIGNGELIPVVPETFELVRREKTSGISPGWFYRFKSDRNTWNLIDLSAVRGFEMAEKPDGNRP